MGGFLFAAGWIVVVFADSGLIMVLPMIILGADILIAGLLELNLEQAAKERLTISWLIA